MEHRAFMARLLLVKKEFLPNPLRFDGYELGLLHSFFIRNPFIRNQYSNFSKLKKLSTQIFKVKKLFRAKLSKTTKNALEMGEKLRKFGVFPASKKPLRNRVLKNLRNRVLILDQSFL